MSASFGVRSALQLLAVIAFVLHDQNSYAQTFAVIGDYGWDGEDEVKVAKLIKGSNPDFIITTGDNNYPYGAATTIDRNIGKYFYEYIHPYKGAFGEGAKENRFFPTIGNHDLDTDNGQAYFEYFELGGNERYYDFVKGDVHFFALNSNQTEPDGVDSRSKQAEWLKEGLEKSTSIWKVVYFHHPPYSTSIHETSDWMRWPFQKWGASVVLSGHDHVYERIVVDDFTYVTNGLGSNGTYEFEDFKQGLFNVKAQYNSNYGALKVSANAENLDFEFHSVADGIIDKFQISRNASADTLLFDSDKLLNVTIETDLSALLQDRDIDAKYHKAKVSVGNGPYAEMQLKVRGNFRSMEANCAFPPFFVRVPKKTTGGGYFDSHSKLKIVNPCSIDPQYEQFIAQEFLAYKVFNLLTDSSFRVQPLQIKYLNTSNQDTVRTFSFFIEDAQSLGWRLGAKEVEEVPFYPVASNYSSSTLIDLFQFMLGNADWGFPDHNLQVFAAPKKDSLMVPYDFDLSGMVNADYSHLKNENDYRGFCHSQMEYDRVIANFNLRKTEILDLYKTTELLNPANKDHSLGLIEKFYGIINDPTKFKAEVLEKCSSDR